MTGPTSGKRKLTPFLAHEMLYDYVTGNLDSERRQAVEEFIATDRESQNLVEAIRRGISFSQSLQKIQLSPNALSELEQAENFVSLTKRLARWSSWPDSLRWSIIAVVISACTAGLMVLIPWKSVPLFAPSLSRDDSTFEVARIDDSQSKRDEDRPDGTAPSDVVASTDENQNEATGDQSGDEEFAEESSGQVAVPAVVVTKPSPPPAPAPTPTPARVNVAAASSPPAAPTPAAAAKTQNRGFVYRAFMTLPELDVTAAKITQQVKELGAEKAGEVELGWQRGSGRYYHFTLPEANEQKLLEALRVYGPVRISKDPHPRQMPAGEVRFILWIESGG